MSQRYGFATGLDDAGFTAKASKPLPAGHAAAPGRDYMPQTDRRGTLQGQPIYSERPMVPTPELSAMVELTAAIRELASLVAQDLAARTGQAVDLEPDPIREGVDAEQAADEIIRLLEASPRPLRPSELGQVLQLDMTTVLDGLDLLKERCWVADADEGEQA